MDVNPHNRSESSIRIVVDDKDFSLAAEVERVRRLDVGAIVTFVGTVRDLGGNLQSLFLEHYAPMTRRHLRRLATITKEIYAVDALTVYHRVGTLYPTDNIVLVVCATQHRQQAFVATQHIVESLKTTIPFWKREKYIQEKTLKWIDPPQQKI